MYKRQFHEVVKEKDDLENTMLGKKELISDEKKIRATYVDGESLSQTVSSNSLHSDPKAVTSEEQDHNESDLDYSSDSSLVDEINATTGYEDLTEYSDGVSEHSDDSDTYIDSLLTKQKAEFKCDTRKRVLESSTISGSFEVSSELQNPECLLQENGMLNQEDSEMKSKCSMKTGFPETSTKQLTSPKEIGRDVLYKQDENSISMDTSSRMVVGHCQTKVHGNRNEMNTYNDTESEALPCWYCLQDDKKSEAITYCMDCGLYMCATCRRFHRKFFATRGHCVVVQQELIPTEFDQYKPGDEENRSTEIMRDSSPSPLLDKTLVDPGRYSRSLTPTYNSLCGPCLSDDVEEVSTHFCQDCGDYMCRLCYQFHQKLQLSCDQHSVLHHWNCEDFETFVPTIHQNTENFKETRLPERPFLTPFKANIGVIPKDNSHFEAKLQPIGRFTTKLTSDPRQCSIAGIDCFPDGKIVLTDENNGNVKLFSSGYEPLGNLELQGHLADVAVVTNQMAVVFIPDESELVFVKINGKHLSFLRNMKTASKYVRIASQCEEIYALCNFESDGHLWMHILNANGDIVSFIHLDLTQSEIPQIPPVPSLAISPAGGTVYISDKNHCVFAFGIDGRRIFKHENLDMFDITDFAADSRSVYVCCKAVDSIFKMSYDGHNSCKVVSKTPRIASPRTIAVKENILFVGLCDSDTVHIYSLV